MPRRLNKSKLSKKSKRGGSRKKSMNRRKNILKKKRKINTKKKLLKKRNHFLRGGMDNRNKIAKLEEAHDILNDLQDQATKVPNPENSSTSDNDWSQKHKYRNSTQNYLESVKTNVRSLNDILGNHDIIPNEKSNIYSKFVNIYNGIANNNYFPKRNDPLEFLKEKQTQADIIYLIQNVGKYIIELKGYI